MSRAVLVTGSGGFIGRHLVRRLAASGWRVRAASREPAALGSAPGVEHARMPDLSGPVDWTPLLAGMSHVLHLAGIAHSTEALSEATYMAVNADATAQLARAARAAGLRRVVLMSSVRAQCGAAATGILTEATQPTPDDAYGRSKLAAEQRLAAALDGAGTDWTVLRPVVVYGPDVKANMRALARLAGTRLPLPLAALSGRRSLVGVETLGDIVIHVLDSPATSRRTLLAADPGPLTVGEIVAAMRLGLGRGPGRLAFPPAMLRLAAGLTGRTASLERLTGDLVVSTGALEASGWKPRESTAEGLARWMAAENARHAG